MIEALKASAKGEIKKHLVNIDVYLHNPVAVSYTHLTLPTNREV